MKTKLLFGVCGLVMLMVGCTKDPTKQVVAPQSIPIQLLGFIDQVATSRVNDEGFCNNDGIGIYVVNYQNGAPGTLLSYGNQADNVRYVYNEPENKWTPDSPVYYYDKITPVDIVGYYPYVSNIDNVNTYSFEVAKDQSTDATNGLMGGYEVSDFLWGKAEDVSPAASRVNITFNHKMAGVQIELTEGTGWGDNEWAGLDKQVLLSNTIRKASIDLANGKIIPVGDVPATGTVPAKSGETWRAVVVPQIVEASMALINITVNGTTYVYRKNSSYEYHSGQLHKFIIEVSKKSESGLEFKLIGEAITAWESETITHDGTAREYVVINVPGALTNGSSALKAAIEASSKDYAKIKNLKITGEVNAYDFYFMRDEMTALRCVNMKEVTIKQVRDSYGRLHYANEIPQEAFNSKKELVRFVFPDNITKIATMAFCGTSLTGTLVLPNGVQDIGINAFSDCSGLTGELILPKSLVRIEYGAFMRCNGFYGALEIPDLVTDIQSMAFSQCSGFTSLKLPDNLETLGSGAFLQCYNMAGSLVIPDKVTNIPSDCFASSPFGGTLSLPSGLLTIENSAFFCCRLQGSLKLPENLLIIGDSAFAGNLFSGNLVLPKNLVNLDSQAFLECSRLTGVVEIPDDVISLSSGVFRNCTQLKGVIFPRSMEHIGENAFENCYQLNSIICKAQTPPYRSINSV